MIKTAVIIVAGLGSRLKPLTNTCPKCLIQIKGKPILVNTLENLEKVGIEEAVIVIGHLGNVIKESIGDKFGKISIKYIKNEIYDKTNSMYSVWLARDYLKKGAILIEGDAVSELGLLQEVMKEKYASKSCWVANKFTPEYDGSMSTTDENNRIIDIKIIRGTVEDPKENNFKSTGIVKINPELGSLFAGWLDEEVKKNNLTQYYDLVLAKHINEHPIYICDITGMKWFEIDNFEDIKRAEEIFGEHFGVKFVVIIGDGMSDKPIEELDGKTPLEAANTPNMDLIARSGKTGTVQTIYEGLPIGSIIANMGLLGYHPEKHYPHGRASFEALAQNIHIGEKDIVFRCNLVSLENNKIKDFTAKFIDDKSALYLLDNLKYKYPEIEIYIGQSYRNLLIIRDADIMPNELILSEPHMNVGKNIEEIKVKHTNERSRKYADMLNTMIHESINQFKELNKERNTNADSIWVWSSSSKPYLPSFYSRFRIKGAIVAGLDFMRGIGICAGMETKEIKGATGYLDTNMKEKLKYAKNFLRHNDLVFIHINAPDEASHEHSIKNKIKAIERIDSEIIGPLLEHLNREYPNSYRIAVLPDHSTYISDGKHGEEPVPFAISGRFVKKDNCKVFSEKEIALQNPVLLKSYDFLNYMIKPED